jgi:hypothetical protein
VTVHSRIGRRFGGILQLDSVGAAGAFNHQRRHAAGIGDPANGLVIAKLILQPAELDAAFYSAMLAENSPDPTERQRAPELWAAFNEQLAAKAHATGDAELIGIVERVLWPGERTTHEDCA